MSNNLTFHDVPEHLQAVAVAAVTQWKLQSYAITISIVPEAEVLEFTACDPGVAIIHGGCRTEYEYQRATIKLSAQLEDEKKAHCLQHEIRHIHYAEIDEAIGQWVEAWRDLLPVVATKQLIASVDVAVNRAIENDL